MSIIGEHIKLTVFGESHGPAIGMVLDGIPTGVALDMAYIQRELSRRAPGNAMLHSARKEPDVPEFLSGLVEGKTTGAPISAIIYNLDARPEEYNTHLLRPGHADLAAYYKFNGACDMRGGGPFSGRLTAVFVLAGAICKQILSAKNIQITAKLVQAGTVTGEGREAEMHAAIARAKEEGDSLGSVVSCEATGVPGGVGGLLFSGMESRIAAMLYAIPGVKGVEFGAGFAFGAMRGSEANDPICLREERIVTETNHSGGINGGITNGMPLVVRVAFRPTPTIARAQRTVDIAAMQEVELQSKGRHDACIGPRALPVVEACLAFCILDAMQSP